MNKIYNFRSKFLSLFSFLLISFSVLGQTPSASFATWKDNKKAAYTIIHDDYSSYVTGIFQHAYPIATARGIKISFGAITGSCGATEWANARTMIAAGHECVNHSHNHKCGGSAGQCTGLSTYSAADFNTELTQSTNLIQTNTGVKPLFFIHPYDASSDAILNHLKVNLGYLGTRAGTQGVVNASNFTDFLHENYFVYDGTAAALSSLNTAVNTAISSGGYAVREFHGIADGSWAAMTIANYTSHLDYVKLKIDDGSIWSATSSEVITYKMQRDAWSMGSSYIAATNSVAVNFNSLSAIDASILKTPVTINVNLNGIAGNFDVFQNNSTTIIPSKRVGNIISFNVYPHQGNITLKCNNCSGTTPPTTVAAFDAAKCYRISARHSGKALEITTNSTLNGILIQQNRWKGKREQIWRIKSFDGTHYQVSNGYSGRLMTVANSSTADVATVYQYANQNTDNQKWQFDKNTEGYFFLSPKHAATKVLDINGGSTANGANAIQYAKTGGTNQQFTVAEVGCPAGVQALESSQIVVFEGKIDNRKAVLQWVVNNEDLKDYYEIEKADDNHDFQQLTVVNGNSSDVLRTFSYTDENIVDGDNYYRLKSIAADGSVKTSEVVKLRYAQPENYTLSPNPASDVLDIDLSDIQGKAVELTLISALGKVIRSEKIESVDKTHHKMSLDNVENGQYFVKIQAADKRMVIKKLVVIK